MWLEDLPIVIYHQFKPVMYVNIPYMDHLGAFFFF